MASRQVKQGMGASVMALINHDKKYIFLHIYKTGGMSLRQLLSGEEVIGSHCSAIDLKETLYNTGKREVWDEYFKFAVVRNPYDWMVSLIGYITRFPSHGDHQQVSGMTMTEFLIFCRDVAMKRERPHGSNKYMTLTQFLCDKNKSLLVDKVIKFENIDQEVSEMQKRLGISFNTLPKKNINGQREKDYHTYFNQEAAGLVAEIHKDDLELFQYEF